MTGDFLYIVFGGLFLALVLLAVWSARGPRMPRSLSGIEQRERALEAQAAVEEHDVGEMLAAQAKLREHLGRPSIADELVAEALEDDPERDG